MTFCTTVIPTIGRPSLERSVNSALNQEAPDFEFEVIVVNDSGKELQQARWMADRRVNLLTTDRQERSIAMNTGASAARGQFVHFLADDDWLLPEAYLNFKRAAEHSEAGWICGASRLVDRSGKDLIVLRHNANGNYFINAMAGEWIPVQASIICTDLFHSVGGYDSALTGGEDIDLLRRIMLVTDIASIEDAVVTIEMGQSGSSTDYSAIPVQSRAAREAIIDRKKCLSRLLDSSDSYYWDGRILRVYLTSAIWNALNRKPSIAFERLLGAAQTLVETWPSAMHSKFWHSAASSYEGEAFRNGFAEVSRSGSKESIANRF